MIRDNLHPIGLAERHSFVRKELKGVHRHHGCCLESEIKVPDSGICKLCKLAIIWYVFYQS